MSTSTGRGLAGSIGSFVTLGVALMLINERPVLAQKKHAAEGKVRSIKSDIETSIEFFNQSQDVIKVYWLNLEGKREKGQTLNPGDRVTLKTFLNHAWVLTDAKDNAIGLYYPDADKRVIAYGQANANPFGKGGFGKAGKGGFKGKGGFGGPGGGGFAPGGFGKSKRGGASVATSKISYVQDSAAAAELKLTAEQTAKIKGLDAKLKNDLQGLAQQGLPALQKSRKTAELRQDLDRDIANLLDPAQNKRLDQMIRQDLGNGLFTEKTLADALQFTPEQMGKLAPVRAKFVADQRDALDADPNYGPAFVKKLAQARKTALDATTAVLTADQKTIWNELVGAPWNGYVRKATAAMGLGGGFGPGGTVRALRTRAYEFNNWTSSTARFLSEKSVQDALKLTNDQRNQLPLPRTATADRLLTPAQLKLYQGIYLQQSMTAYGPAGKFRYREVLDAVKVTDAQKGKILTIGQDDARAYADLVSLSNPPPAKALKKLDEATEAKLDAVLTAEQRKALKTLIGEPFTGAIQNPFGLPTFSKGTVDFGGKAGKGGKKRSDPLP